MLLAAVACSTPEQKAKRFLETGQSHFDKGDYNRALLAWKNAAQLKPKDPEPQYRMALVLLRLGDGRNAVGFLNAAIALDPKYVPAQVKLAELMVGTNDKKLVSQAEEKMRNILPLSHDDVSVLTTLAEAESRMGRTGDAERRLAEVILKAPDNQKAILTLARVKLSTGDWAGAESVLKKATTDNPSSVSAVLALSQFYILQKNMPEAEKQLRRAISMDPANSSALLGLADLQEKAGKAAEAEATYRSVSELPDRSHKSAYGQYLFRNRKYDQALAEFKRWSSKFPEDRELRGYLVWCYLFANQKQNALAVLQQALKANSKDVDAMLQRAGIYFGDGKFNEARNDVIQVLQLRPDSAQAHFLSAALNGKRGDKMTQRQELYDALKCEPAFLAARIELSRLLISDHMGQAAVDLLDGAPPNQRQLVPVFEQRNWSLISAGKTEEANKNITTALANLRSPELLLQQATLRLKKNDFRGARESAEEALNKSPEDVRILSVLVSSRLAEKQAPQALAMVKEHAAKHPRSAAVQQFLGKMLVTMGDNAGARNAFTAAKQVDPQSTENEEWLAKIDLAEHKVDAARERLKTVVASHPDNLSARILLAESEWSPHNQESAIEEYRKTLAIDSNNVVALNNLAYLLAESDKPDEALKYAERAKELAPQSPVVDNTLGWVLYRKGLYGMSIRYLEMAAKKEPTALRNVQLGMAYLKNGDLKQGRTTLTAGIRMDPNLPESRVAQALLNGDK